MRKLILDTNKALGERKLADSVVDKTFEMWWPDLHRDVTTILAEHHQVGDDPEPSEKDMITEILELSRLAARRADSGDISPRAVSHIFKAIKNVHRLIKIREDPERIMDALKKAKDPLFYMERRVRGGNLAEVEEAHRDLDFEVNPQPLNDDDEIPF